MLDDHPAAGAARAYGRGAGHCALAPPDRSLCAVVVVPARDEEQRIEACLGSLTTQRAVARERYEVVVVLDGCRDATHERLREHARREPSLRLHALVLERAEGVGRARRRGMDIACARLLSAGRPDGLIASTDADSVVAEDWLAVQLELARLGASAIGGEVQLDPREIATISAQALADCDVRAADGLRAVLAHEGQQAPAEHHQFSGASLALTADTYRRCGGLPVHAAHEDEALERELRLRGVTIHRSRRVRVTTSARTSGRAPRGLAHDLARSDWRARRSHVAHEFPLRRLLAAKRASIALVLPVWKDTTAIGEIATAAGSLRGAGLLDHVLVVDAGAGDAGVQIAADARGELVRADELSAELGPVRGKGDALWRALRVLDSDLVAFVDTAAPRLDAVALAALLGPLICDPAVRLVKGVARGPSAARPEGARRGGAVSELMARPLLNLHAPELAVFDQPLSGHTAARRELLQQVPFSAGHGVQLALLIDAWRLVGLDGLAQVDLDVAHAREPPPDEAAAIAYAVLVAAQTRFLGADFADAHACGSISLAPNARAGSIESLAVTVEERPALASMRSGARAQARGLVSWAD